MKKILLSLLFAIPLLAYGYTPSSNLSNNAPSDITMKSSTTASEANRIENDDAITLNYSLNDTVNTTANTREIKAESNTVPVPVALPLLAVAIGLFGFGANRRRV